MERKAKVTQNAVNAACDELVASGKNITVNAVISITGGSFSTVGVMVKNWKAEQAANTASVMEMPEVITTAMQKATSTIWEAASELAGNEISRVHKETTEAMDKARAELSEYTGEIARLEKELEHSLKTAAVTEKHLSVATAQVSELTVQKTALETRLSDHDNELKRLRKDYEKLKNELVKIAKSKGADQSK